MRRDKQEAQARFNRRALLLGGAGAAVFAGLGARLYSLQILEQETYRLQADDNQFNYRLQPPVRGRLLDRFGEAIAENRESYRLLIVPEQAGDPRAALERLSAYMPLSEGRIERLLRQIQRSPRFKPVTIAEDLDWETFSRINLHLPELAGITPDVGEVRTYPHPQALAHVTGYVQAAPPEAANDDPLLLHPGFRIGRTGVEASLDQRLRGRAGQLKVEVNAVGRVLRELPDQSIAPIPGEDIALTIDVRAQRNALQVLDGQSASAVAMDVETGEILVLASSPSFDPERLRARHRPGRLQRPELQPLSPAVQQGHDGAIRPGLDHQGHGGARRAGGRAVHARRAGSLHRLHSAGRPHLPLLAARRAWPGGYASGGEDLL
jgi:penicillin-binding protein 2